MSESAPSQVHVLFFTDLKDSVGMKSRLGDRPYADLIAQHNRLFRNLLAKHGGCEKSQLGDGFFAAFPRPSSAVACALEFVQALALLSSPEPLDARIGIHLGEVLPQADNASSVEPQIVGLAIDTAARVQSLA